MLEALSAELSTARARGEHSEKLAGEYKAELGARTAELTAEQQAELDTRLAEDEDARRNILLVVLEYVCSIVLKVVLLFIRSVQYFSFLSVFSFLRFSSRDEMSTRLSFVSLSTSA